MTMEAADRDFTNGFRYLMAARRCEDWGDDGVTRGQLHRPADAYRARANVLMGLVGATRGDSDAAPGREPWGNPADCARGVGGRAQWK